MDENKIDKNLIGNIPVLKPSMDFSSKVMNQINLEEKVEKKWVYQPVISKSAVYTIFGSIALFIIISIFNQNSEVILNTNYTLPLEGFKDIGKVDSPLLAISLFTIFFLLAFEKFMNRFSSIN